MADPRPPRTSLLLSPEALFRYQIVSAVQARVLSGQQMDAAVRAVAAQTHRTPAGEFTTVSVRSIYRWLAEHDRDEVAAAEPVSPVPMCDISLMAITETGPSRSPKPDHRDRCERWTVMNHSVVDFDS